MLYFDSATDRRTHDRRIDHEDRIEAFRAGYIYAHDAKAYGRWRAGVVRRLGVRGAKGGLAQLLAAAGGNVERGGFEFRTA